MKEESLELPVVLPKVKGERKEKGAAPVVSAPAPPRLEPPNGAKLLGAVAARGRWELYHPLSWSARTKVNTF